MRQIARLQANITTAYNGAGTFFYMETAPAALVQVRFLRAHSQLKEEIDAVNERGWRASIPAGFDRVELLSAVAQDVVVHVCDGDVGVNIFSGVVSQVKPTTIDTVADVALDAGAATQILPADATRREAIISNLSTNANSIRVGDSNVAAARGAEVQPGQSITIEGTEAIYGFDAAAESVGVTIIKD